VVGFVRKAQRFKQRGPATEETGERGMQPGRSKRGEKSVGMTFPGGRTKGSRGRKPDGNGVLNEKRGVVKGLQSEGRRAVLPSGITRWQGGLPDR